MSSWQPPYEQGHVAGQQPVQPYGYEQQQPYAPQPPQGQEPSPRRDNVAWAAGITVALIIAAACGVYVLHNDGIIGQPLTCADQYANWKGGPANAAGKQAEADAAAVSAAGKSEDITEMDSSLKALGADAAALQAYPMPACADPAGYWQQYLSAMKAAGDNAGTASGLGALILAYAPLKQVPAIQSKLTAELAKTAGVEPAS
jgi:hypothetical protein